MNLIKTVCSVGIALSLLTGCSPNNAAEPISSKPATSTATEGSKPTTNSSPEKLAPTQSILPTTAAEISSDTQIQSMLAPVMAVNSFSSLQEAPIAAIGDIDYQALNTYISSDVIDSLEKKIKDGESQEVFDVIAINVKGLKVNNKPVEDGLWLPYITEVISQEEVYGYHAGDFTWDATKLVIKRQVVIPINGGVEIVTDIIAYYLIEDETGTWTIIGMEPHE